MKQSEQLLSRVFMLARHHREPAPSEPSFGVETAVLTQWRISRTPSKESGGILPVFRWAAIVACLFALLSGMWKRGEIAQLSHRFDPETSVVNSAFVGIE
jgi:hypothetical protein